MIKCKNCGSEFPDGVKFCGNCGAKLLPDNAEDNQKVPETEIQSEPPEQINEEKPSFNCQEESIRGDQEQAKPIPAANQGKKLNKKTVKTLLSVLAVALVVLLIATAVLPSVFGGSSSKIPEAVIYFKDGEINYSSLKNIAPIEISEGIKKATSLGSGDSSISVSSCITLSKDGSRLFYPDKIDSSSSGFTLYYKDLKNISSSTEAVKIDSDIISYRTDENAKKVVYLKSEGNLYENDLTSKDKIDSEVNRFYVNSSATRVIYVKTDGTIYYKDSGKEKQKIDSESAICYISDDYGLLYYTKDGSLYRYDITNKNEKTKIDTEVSRLLSVYKSGELYYLKNKSNILKYSDYVDDDMKSSDEAMTKPTEPETPDYSKCETIEDIDKLSEEYQKELNQYLKDNALYSAKEERDEMRTALSEKEYKADTSTLCYYDGKTSSAVNESVSGIETVNGNTPVCVFNTTTKKEISKLKLSEISSVLEVEEHIESCLSGESIMYTALKGSAYELDSKKIYSISINYSGSTIYYIDDYNIEKSYGTLNEIAIKDGKLGSVQKYDDDVNSIEFLFNSDTFVYFKNVKNEHGDLMLNKEIVDSDVTYYGVMQIPQTEKFLYAVDYDSTKGIGTLKMYDGKKTLKIADDVKEFYVVNEKCITYMQNYSSMSSKGDLYLYDGSENRKQIDTDITDIVYINWLPAELS